MCVFPLSGFNFRTLESVLQVGTVVITHEKFITGIVMIDAPFDKVWNVVTDYESYGDFVPNVKQLKILRREGNKEVVEYKLKFAVLGFFGFTVVYTLEHTYKNGIVVGLPSKEGKQVFKEVCFKKIMIPTGSRTILVYTAYADLSSFGVLAKLIFKWFPELERPALAAVTTLFPESLKERIEGRKIITKPKRFEQVDVPRIDDITPLLPLMRKADNVMISFYPDKNNIRFFAGYTLTTSPIGKVKKFITDFKNYPRFLGIVKHISSKQIPDGYEVDVVLKYKIALPIELRYSLKYKWLSDNRLYFELNENKKHDIAGKWGAWDFWTTPYGTVISYVSFTNLRLSNFFLKLLMDKIEGFDVGLEVGLTGTLMNSFKENL